jgi:Protein of unknown function (DUF2924)
MTASASELEDEIAHLRDLDLRGLQARWHSVFRRKAPDHLPRHLLYRMIAYRLQAERLGDLDRVADEILPSACAGTSSRYKSSPDNSHAEAGSRPQAEWVSICRPSPEGEKLGGRRDEDMGCTCCIPRKAIAIASSSWPPRP